MSQATDADTTATATEEFSVSLNEFCTILSQSDTRVELISAFHHTESAAGRVADVPSAYNARYVAFLDQPI